MQEINEAYRFLLDDEARALYDRKYSRFNEESEPDKEDFKQQKPQSKRDQTGGNDSKHEEQDQAKDDEFAFEYDDELLKRWMENARKQIK